MDYIELLKILIDLLKEYKSDNFKDDNSIYKLMEDLIEIEKICKTYTNKLEELNESEFTNFRNFAQYDKKLRKDLEEKYQIMYELKTIDNDKFLKEYNDFFSYVVALILSDVELDTKFFEILNKKMNKENYPTDIPSLERTKHRSFYLKELYSKQDDLFSLFRKFLMEISLLLKIYKANEVQGINLYDGLNSIMKMFNNQENDMNRRLNPFGKTTETSPYCLADLCFSYIDINDKSDLVVALTSESDLRKFLIEKLRSKEFGFSAQVFLKYLVTRKDFLDKICEKKDGKYVFKNIKLVFDEMDECKVPNTLVEQGIISGNDLHDLIRNYESVLNEIAKGSIEIDSVDIGNSNMGSI